MRRDLLPKLLVTATKINTDLFAQQAPRERAKGALTPVEGTEP
jgi:hypothetical protein